jgi:hypothetical protein
LGAKVATAFGYDDVALFLKLYILSKATRMIMPYVVKLLEIANNMAEIEWDITDCKKRYKMKSRNSNYHRHLCSSSNHTLQIQVISPSHLLATVRIIGLPKCDIATKASSFNI